jgi:hypothetical protein
MKNKPLTIFLTYRDKNDSVLNQINIENPSVIPQVGDFIDYESDKEKKFVVTKRTIRYNSHLDYLFIHTTCND